MDCPGCRCEQDILKIAGWSFHSALFRELQALETHNRQTVPDHELSSINKQIAKGLQNKDTEYHVCRIGKGVGRTIQALERIGQRLLKELSGMLLLRFLNRIAHILCGAYALSNIRSTYNSMKPEKAASTARCPVATNAPFGVSEKSVFDRSGAKARWQVKYCEGQNTAGCAVSLDLLSSRAYDC